ncbi:MAG: TlpA family protein disulfide reductase [Anaeroplasma sp.]
MNKRSIQIIGFILLNIITILVLIYANFIAVDKILKVNDKCDSLVLTFNNEEFNIKNDDKSVFLYFFDEYNEAELTEIEKQYNSLILTSSDFNEKINLFAVVNSNSSNKYQDKISNYQGNIKFAYDNNNKALKKFTKDKKHFVFINSDDVIVSSQSEMIDSSYFESTIMISLLGYTLGNKVGDYCYIRNIGLLDSDDVFNVYKNKGKITIINFWYTSCTPCIKELPYFNQIASAYKDDVTVIAIHQGDSYMSNPTYVSSFVKKAPNLFSDLIVGYDSSTSNNGSIYYNELGGKDTWPYTVIVDQNGIISMIKSDAVTYNVLETEILRLKDLYSK